MIIKLLASFPQAEPFSYRFFNLFFGFNNTVNFLQNLIEFSGGDNCHTATVTINDIPGANMDAADGYRDVVGVNLDSLFPGNHIVTFAENGVIQGADFIDVAAYPIDNGAGNAPFCSHQ